MQTSPTWQSPTPHHETFWQVCRSYWQLTKPRIIPLLLIETAASMLVAAHGTVDPLLLLVTLLTGALAAASDRKSTRLNSSHVRTSRMPSSA